MVPITHLFLAFGIFLLASCANNPREYRSDVQRGLQLEFERYSNPDLKVRLHQITKILEEAENGQDLRGATSPDGKSLADLREEKSRIERELNRRRERGYPIY